MARPSVIPYGEEVPAAQTPPEAARPGWSAWALAAITMLLCVSWMLSDLSWIIDLVGSFAPQLGWAALAVSAWLLFRRARIPAGVAALGAMLGFLSMGVARADRADPAPPAQTVRVLQFNARTTNPSGAEAFEMIMGSNADVVAITEPPQQLLDLIRAKAGGTYVWTDFPANAGPGWRLTLSRWPIEKLADLSDSTFSKMGFWIVRIKRPNGPFVFIQAHPDSPRTRERWASGRDQLHELAKIVDSSIRPLRLPIIMAADLNSPPSGLRGRLMNERFGFERTKPRTAVTGGTYPAWLPGPFRLAIDDVFVQSVFGVSGWKTMGPAGSDHMAVCVDIVLRDIPPEADGR
jgi:endonuclease/exonuclease/phosphatase (EEP) superfamily protein YafD